MIPQELPMKNLISRLLVCSSLIATGAGCAGAPTEDAETDDEGALTGATATSVLSGNFVEAEDSRRAFSLFTYERKQRWSLDLGSAGVLFGHVQGANGTTATLVLHTTGTVDGSALADDPTSDALEVTLEPEGESGLRFVRSAVKTGGRSSVLTPALVAQLPNMMHLRRIPTLRLEGAFTAEHRTCVDRVEGKSYAARDGEPVVYTFASASFDVDRGRKRLAHGSLVFDGRSSVLLLALGNETLPYDEAPRLHDLQPDPDGRARALVLDSRITSDGDDCPKGTTLVSSLRRL
jgi:hypothetical protein